VLKWWFRIDGGCFTTNTKPSWMSDYYLKRSCYLLEMLVCFDGLLSFSVVRAGGECFLFLFFWFLAKKKG